MACTVILHLHVCAFCIVATGTSLHLCFYSKLQISLTHLTPQQMTTRLFALLLTLFALICLVRILHSATAGNTKLSLLAYFAFHSKLHFSLTHLAHIKWQHHSLLCINIGSCDGLHNSSALLLPPLPPLPPIFIGKVWKTYGQEIEQCDKKVLHVHDVLKILKYFATILSSSSTYTASSRLTIIAAFDSMCLSVHRPMISSTIQ